MNKMILTAAVMVLAAAEAVAGRWKGLDEDNHYSGPKLTEEYLEGKVVLVDCWGVYCPPCRALLPNMEKYWREMKDEKFVLVGSHCQGRETSRVMALVRENRLTYPVYERFGLAEGEPSFRGIPFLYVVDSRGRVVYAGHREKEAEDAVAEALKRVNGPWSITGRVKLNAYKSFEKQLVLGKDIKRVTHKLESDIKKADSKLATDAIKKQAREAKELLKAIEESKECIKDEIREMSKKNPEEAKKKLKEFLVTFPEEKAALKKSK